MSIPPNDKFFSQNIKETLSVETVYSILKDICCKEDNGTYLFNKVSYKRAVMFKKLQRVVDTLKPHYYISKQFYLTRKMSYKSFTTVLRQLCRYAKIHFDSNIRYMHSSYLIEYKIYL